MFHKFNLTNLSVLIFGYTPAIGVSKYNDRDTKDLTYADSDAQKFSQFAKNLPNNKVVEITNGEATGANILENMQKVFSKARPEDTIWFYFSGHGYVGGLALPEGDNLYFNSMVNLLKKSKSKTKIVMLDSCHSGTVQNSKSGHGKVSLYKGLMNAFNGQKDNESNYIVFASSAPDESSWESSSVGGGYFTYYLLRGLINYRADSNNDKKVTANELYNYVNLNVAYATGNSQNPEIGGVYNPDYILYNY